jgi:hypothetical protein
MDKLYPNTVEGAYDQAKEYLDAKYHSYQGNLDLSRHISDEERAAQESLSSAAEHAFDGHSLVHLGGDWYELDGVRTHVSRLIV